MATNSKLEYKGTLSLPGEQEDRSVALVMDSENQSVDIHFDESIEGANDWSGTNVRMAQRVKYHEVMFTTVGIPKETVRLTWKFNASLLDNSLAGVVIAQPNDLRISGERGFILEKPN